MIFDAADDQGLHAVLPRDPAQERPKAGLKVRRDRGPPPLGAERAMVEAAGEGMAHRDVP